MFDNCDTLMSLNAARVKACSVPGADIVAVNNAYNEQRTKLLQARQQSYKKVSYRPIVIGDMPKFKALPITGVSQKLGAIILAEDGFYL